MLAKIIPTIKQIKPWLKHQFSKIKPGETAVAGSRKAIIVCAFILYFLVTGAITWNSGDPWLLVFFVVMALLFVIGAFAITWLTTKIFSIPKAYRIALLMATPLLLFAFGFEVIYVLVALITFACLGAGWAVFAKGQFSRLTKVKQAVTLFAVSFSILLCAGAIYGYTVTGFQMEPVINAAALNQDNITNIAGESPSKKGSYKTIIFSYGSGTDKHRIEFGEQVSIATKAVDGTMFLDGWSGFGGWYREHFWGFDSKNLPLNAKVWMPEGEGPFPLVLIVHGNHLMTDFSDTGYDYLGELLASRGFIFASVDQNFINGSLLDIGGGLEKENDARGWLLLEHLRLWHQWNEDEDSRLFNKIDTDKIALVGHSRGGEAVAHAALLNRMPFFYDDASYALNYNFNIQSLVAIAPVDGQYKPGKTLTELIDINFLTLHGSLDADVTSFMGSSQYERVTFSDNSDFFKAAVYIKDANHGQFNTSWGNNDTLSPTGLLNLKNLLASQDQQEIAKIYISAFLEATLSEQTQYKALFVDARKGKEWLPQTIYLSQFEASDFYELANFDEDFNVLSSTDGNQISGQNLSVWREQEVDLAWRNKGTRAVYLGWHNNKDEDKDQDFEASYSLTLNQTRYPNIENASLAFSVAQADESSNPKSKGKWVNKDESSINDQIEVTQAELTQAQVTSANLSQDNATSVDLNSADMNQDNKIKVDMIQVDGTQADVNKTVVEESEEKNENADDADKDKPAPIDFTITLKDINGESISFPLSHFSALQQPIKTRVWKSQFIKGDKKSENVFQTFVYPLDKISEINPKLNIQALESLTFSFDKSEQGVVIIDQIGFMKNVR